MSSPRRAVLNCSTVDSSSMIVHSFPSYAPHRSVCAHCSKRCEEGATSDKAEHVGSSENSTSRHFVNKARDRSVVLLPEGRLFLNDCGRQALPVSASASYCSQRRHLNLESWLPDATEDDISFVPQTLFGSA